MENVFHTIIDEQLSSVEFVQDYLQLHFDGNTLTFYSWPEVIIENVNYDIGDLLYRNALCQLISQKVTDVLLLEKQQLTIFFHNSMISLNLIRNHSNIGLAELVYFVSVDKDWFVLD